MTRGAWMVEVALVAAPRHQHRCPSCGSVWLCDHRPCHREDMCDRCADAEVATWRKRRQQETLEDRAARLARQQQEF